MFNLAERLIASRNLRPKKKEGFLKVISIFSFLGIMLGVAILIIVMSVMNGFRTDLTNKILGFNAHLIIKPYNNEARSKGFRKMLSKKFRNIKVIDSFSGEAVVMNNENAKGIIIKGLDLTSDKNINFLKKILKEGNNNQINNGHVIIGKQLALNLNLSIGDRINLLSSSFLSTPFGGFPKQENYEIKGVFDSGFYEFDQNVVFLTLDDSLSFFNKSNKDTNLEIYLEDPMAANEIKNNIEKFDNEYFIYSWVDLNKSFFAALKVERNVMFIILTLIIIVAAFNIISGLTILIKNKTKEIAILKTLGLSNNSIIKSFFLTGFTIGLLATITGIVLGIIFSLNIEEIRMFLSIAFNVEIFPEEIYFLDKMPSEISLISTLSIFIFSILITIIASLLPAIVISKMSTIKGLKYE